MLKKLLLNFLFVSSAFLAETGLAQDDEILRPEEAYRYAVFDTGDAIEVMGPRDKFQAFPRIIWGVDQ